MVDIVLMRHRIEVRNYTLGSCMDLEKKYIVYDTAYHHYDHKKKYYVYDKANRTLILPATADYTEVKFLLESRGIYVKDVVNDTNIYNPYNTLDIAMNSVYKPRDEFQDGSIEFLTAKQGMNHSRLLRLPTGVGKTLCAMFAACYYNMVTIIITDNLTTQWQKYILEYTNVAVNEVYIVKGAASIEKTMKGKTSKIKFYVISLKTLQMLNAKSPKLLDDYFKMTRAGLKVIDECHKQTYALFNIDIASPVAETIRLTATPKRSNPSEDKPFKHAYANLPQHGEYVEDELPPCINFVYALFNSHPSSMVQQKCKIRQGFSLTAYANYIFGTKHIRQTVVGIIDETLEKLFKVFKEDEHILIILEINDHIANLYKHLIAIYSESDVGIYTTLVANNDLKQEQLKKKIILTTYSSMGEGKDIKKLKAIISTVTFSTDIRAKQLTGRLRPRDDSKLYFIEILDIGFPSVRTHWITRKKVYVKKAVSEKTLEYECERKVTYAENIGVY